MQFKVQEQTKELEPHKIIKKNLPKFKPKHKPRFYIITNPQDNKQLRITIFHPGSSPKTILDTVNKLAADGLKALGSKTLKTHNYNLLFAFT